MQNWFPEIIKILDIKGLDIILDLTDNLSLVVFRGSLIVLILDIEGLDAILNLVDSLSRVTGLQDTDYGAAQTPAQARCHFPDRYDG